MKYIRSLLFFTVIVLMSGCGKEPLDNEETIRDFTMPAIRYWLCVSFTDQNGNDLTYPLKPKEDNLDWGGSISPTQYDLNIILPNPPKWMKSKNSSLFKMYNFFERYPEFEEQYGEYDGRFFLFNDYMLDYMVPDDFQSYLTYKISCPAIFGDNSVHELVAFWGDDPSIAYRSEDSIDVYDTEGRKIICQYPRCTKAFFDGEEVGVKKAIFNRSLSRDYYSYYIDIVLDR